MSKILNDTIIPSLKKKIPILPISRSDIADGAINSDKLAPNSVVSAAIPNGAVGTAKIADNAITTAKIANLNVTNDKIANTTIAGSKLANNTITRDKLNFSSVNNFSTSAEVPIGSWIDGKTLYQKVFKYTNLATSPDYISKAHGITNVDQIWITSDSHVNFTEFANRIYPLVYSIPASSIHHAFFSTAYSDRTNLYIHLASYQATKPAENTVWVVVHYTKL